MTPYSPHDFDQSDTGWKVFVGMRPIHWVAAELTYVDFGHPDSSTNSGITTSHANVLQRAQTLSGLVFAPMPLPLLDVYGRVGIARLHSGGSDTIVCGRCFAEPAIVVAPRQLNRTNTELQYGGGLQVKRSSLSIRLEYERIHDGHGEPDLLSAGVAWTF